MSLKVVSFAVFYYNKFQLIHLLYDVWLFVYLVKIEP